MDITREKEDPADKEKKIKDTVEETLNARKAIWLKDPSEIKPEEYNEFYKHVSHDYTDPAKAIHYRAEGTSEFTALLYIPQHAPLRHPVSRFQDRADALCEARPDHGPLRRAHP